MVPPTNCAVKKATDYSLCQTCSSNYYLKVDETCEHCSVINYADDDCYVEPEPEVGNFLDFSKGIHTELNKFRSNPGLLSLHAQAM